MEISDFSTHTVMEARETYCEDLNIPPKTRAKLNGRPISTREEPQVILNDDDELVFEKSSHRGLILIGALFAAISITGSVFAIGYVNSTQALLITVNGDTGNFVNISSNNTDPLSWNLAGSSSGDTGNGTLWDINTVSSNYTGDMTAIVYLTNIDKMKHVYRGFGLFLAVYDSAGNIVDINNDNNANIADDMAFLSLNNGVIELYLSGVADIFTVVVDHGFFITHPYDAATWTSAAASPNMYIEMMQR